MLKTIKTGKGSVKLKSNDKSAEERSTKAIEKAKKAKANAETDEDKARQDNIRFKKYPLLIIDTLSVS